MEEYAYIVSHRSRRPEKYRDPRRPRRAAGILIIVLLLLTAGICLLVWLLPNVTSAVTASPSFGGKKFYFLATLQTDEYQQAVVGAQVAADRGGAGYIYNDGHYRIVAAVYDRESDVKALVSVNADSHYFSIEYPKVECGDKDKRALEYLTDEWFASIYTAATELDRGNLTDSAAEFAVRNSCAKLEQLAYNCESEMLKKALLTASGYDPQGARTTLSYIRYIHVRGLLEVYLKLSGY